MNIKKIFFPQKTRKARKFSKEYHSVDHYPNDEWLNQHNILISFVSFVLFVSFVDKLRFSA